MAESLKQRRVNAIEAAYPATTERDAATTVWYASALQRFAALSILFAHGGDDGIIEGIRYSADLIAPSHERTREFTQYAFHHRLLLPHPCTEPDAFVWVDDGDELGDGLYLERVRFMAPGDGPLTVRMQELGDALRATLVLDKLWFEDRQELQALASELVAEEAIRFLRFELVRHQLLDPSGEHLEKLKTIAERGAKHFSLGQLHRLAFMARSKAVNWHERNPKVGKSRATAHAINHFGNLIDDVVSGTRKTPDVHGREDDHDLSAATHLLFGFILDADPLSTTPEEYRQLLAGRPAAEIQTDCDDLIADHSELVEWMRAQSEIDTQAFRAALASVAEVPLGICTPGCAHERAQRVAENAGRSFDKLVNLVGEQNAALAVAEAMSTANAGTNTGRAGDLALEYALQELGFEPETEDESVWGQDS